MKRFYLMIAAIFFLMAPAVNAAAATFTTECLAQGAMWSNVLEDSLITTTGAYGDPNNALGPVTSWATPSYPAWGTGTLVSFNYPQDYVVVGFEDGDENPLFVTNDSNNPEGYDFVVWGNAMATSGGGIFAEPGKVEVSQDFSTWYELTEGWTNRFDVTPTYGEGIVYPDSNLTTYAGGDYFDLASVGLDWIKYIRLSDATGGGTADLDAIAALSTTNSPVPIPGAVWLLGSGLVGLIGIRRKRKEKK